MASTLVTLAGMAKKKGGKRGRPSGTRPTVPVYARVDPQLARVWSEYCDGLDPKTSSSAMLESLMRKHLRSVGLWPPPPGGHP